MSVSMTITCPSCQKRFKGRPELRGKKVRCPICDHGFVVDAKAVDPPDEAILAKKPAPKKAGEARPASQAKPGGKGKPATPAGAVTARPPAAVKDDDEEDGENPYGVTHLDLAPRCPHCANELESEDAIVCLYCGYNTETREVGKTLAVYAITAGEHLRWLLPGFLNAFAVVFLTIACLFFSLAVPRIVSPKSWLSLLDHESMRMWMTFICLGIMWPTGFFAYKRLILEPKPKEKKKE